MAKGLAYQKRLGVNPYKLGFIGGTDSHNGTPSDVSEAGYNGSHGVADGTVTQCREGEIDDWVKGPEANPGSIAGVWATKNTRGGIYDAMARRETFVTSGPRIQPRFFAGAGLTEPQDGVAMVAEGYRAGVPMGGTLTGLTTAPHFTVAAMKDPQGANLDRIQIIKGWVDANGEPQERIIDVVWSGNRVPGPDGRLPPSATA